MPLPRFTPKTTRFLRALKRNNDREWFRAHRAEYDAEVHAPMVAVIERLADDFRTFAPELVADPRRSLYRIYRDTRFSADKSPLKTHIAAAFPPRTGVRHGSAGLYLEVGDDWVWAGGGLYRPEAADLNRVREHIATNYRQLEAIVESPAFRRQCGGLRGDTLTRVPRPFAADHPAAAWLRHKQFLGWREFPGSFAASPRFYPGVRAVFEALAPLVRFLNDAASGNAPASQGPAPRTVSAPRRGRGTGR
jgi:uncharacterized protein (TIGR02453 family)